MTKQDIFSEETFDTIFSNFIGYISSEKVQNQIGVAEDILPNMLYTYVRSPDGINIGRTILWRGSLVLDGCDAQINLEYQVNGSTHLQIRYHKHQDPQGNTYKLKDPESWIKEK